MPLVKLAAETQKQAKNNCNYVLENLSDFSLENKLMLMELEVVFLNKAKTIS
jgi:hypothetical protein